MTTNGPAKFVRGALWASPLVVVPAAFLASIPWLRQQDTAIALGIAAAVAVLVMGYSFYLAARATRRLDEVEIAGQRFAQAQGWTIGIFASGLALVFPPAMNGLADLANSIGAGSPDKAVRLGIVMGFMLVVMLQTLGMVAASIWWGRRLGGRA
jgi:hypothetical protein